MFASGKTYGITGQDTQRDVTSLTTERTVGIVYCILHISRDSNRKSWFFDQAGKLEEE
jgi:hypothetical protein